MSWSTGIILFVFAPIIMLGIWSAWPRKRPRLPPPVRDPRQDVYKNWRVK